MPFALSTANRWPFVATPQTNHPARHLEAPPSGRVRWGVDERRSSPAPGRLEGPRGVHESV